MAWGGRRFKSSQDAKYSNTHQGCTLGHSHRSRLESSVCQLLQLRQKAGEIATIEVEKHMKVCGPIGHECSHATKVELVIDFRLTRPDGTVFYAEAKGFEDPKYPLKRRLWIHNGIGELEIWKGRWSKPYLDEVIK